jgi:hypothetical protein
MGELEAIHVKRHGGRKALSLGEYPMLRARLVWFKCRCLLRAIWHRYSKRHVSVQSDLICQKDERELLAYEGVDPESGKFAVPGGVRSLVGGGGQRD